jgi:serine/threonine protein kinase
MGVLGVSDFAVWDGFGQPFAGLETADLCIFLISFLQTAALSLEHTASLRQTELLATDRAAKILELEARNRDVLLLNDELRRQIGERSRQLSADLRAHPSDAPAPLLSPGLAVADRYEVVRLIGEGGMGAVYEVKRDADGRRCALKTLQGSANRTARARFAREAEIAAKLVHRNLVSLIDFDVTRSGWMFLVFELVDGAAIAEHAERFGDVPWALEILEQLVDGLHALHAGGIVHRDLKPANVLLGRDGVVKITDFGLSTLRADDVPAVLDQADTLDANAAANAALTRTGAIMGTPLYMAPELGGRGSKAASAASDVFSFGVLAYEMLADAYPFASPPVLEVIQGRPPGAAPSLGSLVPSVAPTIAAAVDSCLRVDPAARPTVEALRALFLQRNWRVSDELPAQDATTE